MGNSKTILPMPTINISKLARDCGTSRETIRRLRGQGIDLTDTAAITAALAASRARHSSPAPVAATAGESIQEARRRREIATADRAEIIAKRESGAVIAVSDVEVMMLTLGAELRARLLSMRSDLVVELEGLSGSQIYKALDRRITELLSSIHMKSLNPKP
jgi:hypothetical protein